MKEWCKSKELEQKLREMKIGDNPVFDSGSMYEITKVPNGFIYRKEYEGLVFVPDFAEKTEQKTEQKVEKVGNIKNSVAKTGPKKKIDK